jgi:hypothetical protein
MIDSTHEQRDTSPKLSSSQCWFCERPRDATCDCGRSCCTEHSYEGHCLICGLGFGLFEEGTEPEPVSGLIIVSLSAAARDPYLVKAPALQRIQPLPIAGVERMLVALVKMLQSEDSLVRHRAVSVLAATTNSLSSMNPSRLLDHQHGTGLLCVDQVRRWLMHVLKLSRGMGDEATALAILDKLRTADFRDLYPEIQYGFASLTCSNLGTRVAEVFGALEAFYPVRSPLANERCELIAYEQYGNVARGAGKTMERIYGPLLKYSPVLFKMLKKGTWISNQARFAEWYFGEDEPL